jgi:hypothetical protein
VPETRQQQIKRRIETKGVRFDDIRHPGRLTEEDIACIPANDVFYWIKNGNWKMKDFQKWLNSFSEEE